MAENVAKVIASTPYFKDGFSFQTGVGGPRWRPTCSWRSIWMSGNIKMGWAIGGICGPMVELLKKGKVGKVIDVQDFDLDAVNSIHQTPNHFEMSASQYANPANKGAFVNKLDFVVLAALEVDTSFQRQRAHRLGRRSSGAPGGHPDTAAGSKVCVIVTPLARGRMATVCEDVVTVTTPGDCVDVVVTDYGIAVNPLRPTSSSASTMRESRTFPSNRSRRRPTALWAVRTRFSLKIRLSRARARDGTILDVVRQIKPYTFED